MVDDLVALGSTLIYLGNQHLPWETLVDSSGLPNNVGSLVSTKLLCDAKALCKGFPSVFQDFLTFVLSLKNSDIPSTTEYNSHSHAFQDFEKATRTE